MEFREDVYINVEDIDTDEKDDSVTMTLNSGHITTRINMSFPVFEKLGKIIQGLTKEKG